MAVAGNWVFASILNLTAGLVPYSYVEASEGGIGVEGVTRAGNCVTIHFKYGLHEISFVNSAIIVRRVAGSVGLNRSIDFYVRTNMVDYDGDGRGACRDLVLKDVQAGRYALNYLDSDGTRHKLEDVDIP